MVCVSYRRPDSATDDQSKSILNRLLARPFQLDQDFTRHYINVRVSLLRQRLLPGTVTVHTVNLAFSKLSECGKQGEQKTECLGRARVRAPRCLTSGPSGCCPLTGTGPGRPRAGARAPTCCRATQWTGRTAGCGTGWRNRLHPPPWRSCLSEKCRRHSGSLFAAKGSGRHQGMTGLKRGEERGERGDS